MKFVLHSKKKLHGKTLVKVSQLAEGEQRISEHYCKKQSKCEELFDVDWPYRRDKATACRFRLKHGTARALKALNISSALYLDNVAPVCSNR